jgi:NAD(P)-dependent dehydrogenase (short-subunit alcohol dehydrogenase family)
VTTSLAGKVAIVTGGSRGIGLAIAAAFLSKGIHVGITAINPGHLAENACVGWFGNMESMEHDDWRRVIDTKMTGLFNCCKAAIPRLRRRLAAGSSI